ncbi:hypothetical protein [Robiginitomaculum antarcticum]|uniref:hypothetical protein n=1 Tax=Robiginitomaculum antarcticum TaxID=437507 RepID=UPI000475CA20|nr:hypothetical protein [Robiginitomaculum antarcticum]
MRGLFLVILSCATLMGSAGASADCKCDSHNSGALPQTNGGQSTIISSQRGVKIIRPQSRQTRIIYVASAPSAQDVASRNAGYEDAEQSLRLDALEDRQSVLEDDVDDLYHRPQYAYPTMNGRRVYIAGDPRFAGPYGYTTAPQQRSIRLDGVGVVPPPRSRASRRLIRGRSR